MSPVTGRVLRGVLTITLLLTGAMLLPGSAEVDHARAGSAATPASQKYRWMPALFDFAWEYGESLTSPPYRGTKKKGAWIDTSTGSGRAARHNGGLMIESKYGVVGPADAGPGDVGTTSMTLKGNPQTYGRWELRIRSWAQETTGEDYHVLFELVPEDASKRACGARSITVANFTPRGNDVRYGAYSPSGGKSWAATENGIKIPQVAHAYAVEVNKDHISWFIDGKVVGTLKDKAAIPGVPLTIRLSLVGDGTKEMSHSYMIMDWIRGFPIKNGSQVKSGKALSSGNPGNSC